MINRLIEEALAEIQLKTPRSYPIVIEYLNGVPIKQIAINQDLKIDATRRIISIARREIKRYLAYNSVTNETLLDGRVAHRSVIGKVAILFPSVVGRVKHKQHT